MEDDVADGMFGFSLRRLCSIPMRMRKDRIILKD